MTITFYFQQNEEGEPIAYYYNKESQYYVLTNNFFRVKGTFTEDTPLIKSPNELTPVDIDIDTLCTPERYYDIMSSIKSDVFSDTGSFQVKYGLLEPDYTQVGFLEDSKMMVKINHLKEELNEIEKAYSNKDFAEFCDGLIDLIYVASGTLNLTNAPADILWNDVHCRNMQKVRATKDNVGKRGSTFDVIKPEGWQGPRTKDIIDVHTKILSELKDKQK